MFLLLLLQMWGCGSRTLSTNGDGAGTDQGFRAADLAPGSDRPVPSAWPDFSFADGPSLPTGLLRARACVLGRSCAFPQNGMPQTLKECVDWFNEARLEDRTPGAFPGDPEALSRLERCGAADSCSAFVACYGGNWIGADSCRAGGWCSADFLVVNGAFEHGLYLKCDRWGLRCAEPLFAMPMACCVTAACAPRQGRCEGSHGHGCQAGVPVDFDCALVGGRCRAVDWGKGFECVGEGEPCDETLSAPGCLDAQTHRRCLKGGLATIFCAERAPYTRCASDGMLPCALAQDACDARERLGRCEGSVLHLCVDGVAEAVDCAALGFDTCDAKASRCVRG